MQPSAPPAVPGSWLHRHRGVVAAVAIVVVVAVVAAVVFIPPRVTVANFTVVWGQCVPTTFFGIPTGGETRQATITFDVDNGGLQDGYATLQFYIDFSATGQRQVLVPHFSGVSMTYTSTFPDCADHSIVVKVASVQAV